MANPGQQAPRKEPVYNDEEIAALAAYVASLAPGPAIPSADDYSIDGLSEEEREEAIARGGQIFLTNCTACHNFNGAGGAMPRGGYAPTLHGVEPKYIYEAMLTGPQTMPTFSNGNLSPEEKRDVIAYLGSLEETPEYGGFGLGGLGPVSEGLFAWVLGIGGLVGFAVWIAAHTHPQLEDQGRGRGMTDSHDSTPAVLGGADRQPRPPRPPVASHRRRRARREARRAPGRRASSGSRWCARSSSSSPTSRSRSATTSTPSSVSAPRPSRSASPSAARCC